MNGQTPGELVAVSIELTKEPKEELGWLFPHDYYDPTDDQYNTILKDFHHCVVRNVAADFSMKAILTSDELEPADLMPAEVFALLKKAADSTLLSEHQSAWYNFLLTIHHREHRFTSELLSTFFVERGWNPGRAKRLAEEFDFASGLLAHVHKISLNQ